MKEKMRKTKNKTKRMRIYVQAHVQLITTTATYPSSANAKVENKAQKLIETQE